MRQAAGSTDTRERLLAAALTLIRRQGFTATSVDQLCAMAATTKGGFFHHFASKEALGIAAAQHWSAVTEPFFAAADFHAEPTPLGRILAYLDLREAMIEGDADAYTCLAGTLAQEVHQSHPKIARAAQAAIEGHARTLENDLASALGSGPNASAEARSLALHIQVVLQGAFVIAKAQGDTEAARGSVRHLKSYITIICQEGRQ
jgi:TetR/AcrR family transcriptional repressor of nem operon